MQRSQYDPKTGRETKTNTHIPFGQTLTMDRFLATADKTKREQSIELAREMDKVRSRLHALKNHKPLSVPDTFSQVASALRTLTVKDVLTEEDAPSDFLAQLDVEARTVKDEIAALEERLPVLRAHLDSIWAGSNEHEYELVSVFMHRGEYRIDHGYLILLLMSGRTSGSGHYWTYQCHLPDKRKSQAQYRENMD